MRDGRIQQVDTPQKSTEPANLFVAAFIGSPSMNLVEAGVDGEGTPSSRGTRSPLAPGRRPAPRRPA